MKAEERKELQTNSLVRFVGRLRHGFKGGTSRKAVVIWSIIGLAVVVFIGWKIIANISERRNSQRWLDLDMAKTPNDLDEFIDKNKGTVQANVARLFQAREALREGLTELYRNHDKAEEQLKQAADTYDGLVKPFKNTPILVQECLLGAGKAREGLGELDEALSRYKDLTSRFKEGPVVQEATRGIDRIEKHRAELERLSAEIKKLAGGSATAKKP
jgi:hypothetical protein